MLAQEMHARYAGPQLSFNTMDPTSQIGLGVRCAQHAVHST